MTLRFTPTLAVCALGAAVTGALLALPPADDDDVAPVTIAPAGATADAPAVATIQIADFSFGVPGTVGAGAVVEVTNADGAAHTLTSRDGAFDAGEIGGGATGSFTAPSAAGTYEFFCAIHPSMTGSLVVG